MIDTSKFSQPRILRVFLALTSLLPRATPYPILNPWLLLARCVSVIPAVLDVEEHAFQWRLALSRTYKGQDERALGVSMGCTVELELFSLNED